METTNTQEEALTDQTPETIRAHIEELKAALKAAEQAERDRKDAVLKATPIQWEYFIAPTSSHLPFGEPVYDASITFYELYGEITNLEEAKAVGHNVDGNGKGMTYMYNTLSHQLVMSIGGGYIIISTQAFWRQERENAEAIRESAYAAFRELSAFVTEHPEGGNVTEIIKRHHQVKGR